jgi:23S rRNA maturation mini-RNase III
MVPYIYEDYVSNETYSKAIMKMYETPNEKRKEIGKRAREYVTKEFSMNRLVGEWDRTLSETLNNWKNKNWKQVTL